MKPTFTPVTGGAPRGRSASRPQIAMPQMAPPAGANARSASREPEAAPATPATPAAVAPAALSRAPSQASQVSVASASSAVSAPSAASAPASSVLIDVTADNDSGSQQQLSPETPAQVPTAPAPSLASLPAEPAPTPAAAAPAPPAPSYKQPIPAGVPPPTQLTVPRSPSPAPIRPKGRRKPSDPAIPSIAFIPPSSDPLHSSGSPRYAVLDYSAESGSGQYQAGSTLASLESYLADTAARGMGVGKGGGGRIGESQQTARWVHSSYSALEPRSEWAGILRTLRNLGSFRGMKKVVAGRTYQKQTLTIDESGVGFSIPVYAEDPDSLGPGQGISRTPGSNWSEAFGSAYTLIRPESTVLEALSRVHGRTMKRGRMEFRIEFVRGWRVDDIRMLLLTVLSLRDRELENDLFLDPKRGIMPTAHVHTDGTALLASVLRAVVEVMAEVISFLEESFADAEAVVFMKPAILYQQVLTALKAELLVVKRDISVVENQIRALAGFLVGVAPPGSAWSGSVINVEAVANECLVLRDRTDALLQRCDALVGLVNFEVSAYQNRIIFALTAVSMLFAPAGLYVEGIKMDPEFVIGTPTDWFLGLLGLFVITGIILFVWVSPKVLKDSFEEMVEWDRDALTRSRRIFFKRLRALIDGRRQVEEALGIKEEDSDDEEDAPALSD